VFLADRAGRAGNDTSAAFHAGAAAVIGFPLVWEATVRLHLLGPAASALALLAMGFSLLAVSWRSGLRVTAWVSQVGAFATAFALMGGTRSVLPYTASIVLLALASLWVGYQKSWQPLAWASAAAADLAVVLLIAGALIQGTPLLGLTLSVPLLLFLGYVGALYRRTRPPGVFEFVQASVAALIGYGGALAISKSGAALVTTSGVGLGVATACYARALRRPEDDRHGLLFGSLGLLVALLATLPLPGLAYVWTALAIASVALGSSLDRVALAFHGGAFLLGAAAAAGLPSQLARAFVLAPLSPWPSLAPAIVVLFVAAAAACAVRHPQRDPWWTRVPRAVALLVAAASAGVIAMRFLAPLLPDPAGAGMDRTFLAALRSLVLAGTAIGLGALAGADRVREALWLLYPLLVLSGIKLVIEDFTQGRAATLFVALVGYGLALILAPRLSRKSRS
jgi:hypothetical protein